MKEQFEQSRILYKNLGLRVVGRVDLCTRCAQQRRAAQRPCPQRSPQNVSANLLRSGSVPSERLKVEKTLSQVRAREPRTSATAQREKSATATSSMLANTPLTLPCGVVVPNRIGKSALTEGLSDSLNRATERHCELYRSWSTGGCGLLVTGNIQVDRRYLERPGNPAIGKTSRLSGRA
jgi:hypothetical protein